MRVFTLRFPNYWGGGANCPKSANYGVKRQRPNIFSAKGVKKIAALSAGKIPLKMHIYVFYCISIQQLQNFVNVWF